MAATIWIGAIHFGATDIPVKLHTAVRQNRIQFHLLHKTDRARLRQQMVCVYEKGPVPAEEQIKGFRLDERKYVIVDPEEIEEAEPESGRTIDVHEFVEAGAIDPLFLERTYYLESDGSPSHYAMLAEALKDLNAQGVCTWVMRKRYYFGAVLSDGKRLRLATLRFADEVVPVKSLGLERFPLTERELSIGCELIERLTVHFQPEKYTDEHRIKLQNLIAKKAHGGKIALFKPRHLKSTEPGKLLEALESSLRKVA